MHMEGEGEVLDSPKVPPKLLQLPLGSGSSNGKNRRDGEGESIFFLLDPGSKDESNSFYEVGCTL